MEHYRNNRRYFQYILGDSISNYDSLTSKEIDLLKEAYEKAHDIRKFEIELYWKRASYLWTINAAFIVFLGIMLRGVNSPGSLSVNHLTMFPEVVISIFGIILCTIFSVISVSGKYWQENWEAHINMLEPFFSGHLHKTQIFREKKFYSISDLHDFSIFLLIIFWFAIYFYVSVFLFKETLLFFYFLAPLVVIIIVSYLYFTIYKPLKKRRLSWKVMQINMKMDY